MSKRAPIGGAREGLSSKAVADVPRDRRIASITSGLVMQAINLMRPWHLGHSSTSISNARRIKDAHVGLDRAETGGSDNAAE